MAVTHQPGALAGATPPRGADLSIDPTGPSRLNRWLSASGVLGVCAAGLGFVYAVDPNAASTPYPPCLLKTLTGIDCPGCGGTRALHALLHGDLAAAADHNVIVFVVVPLVLYLAVRYALGRFGRTLPLPQVHWWMAVSVAAFLLAFSVARNIPGTPLHYLQSGLG